MAEILYCTKGANLTERECQKSCESKQNWEGYKQKETTYVKEFPSSSSFKLVLKKHVVIIMPVIQMTRDIFKYRQH